MDEQREHHWNGDRLIELEAPPILSLGLEEEAPGPRFSDLAWPIVLFLLTVFTTLWAGAYATRSNPKEGPLQFLLGDPAALLKGLPFRSEEHTSELQSRFDLVCRLLLEKK